jgi:hypothetical protein
MGVQRLFAREGAGTSGVLTIRDEKGYAVGAYLEE